MNSAQAVQFTLKLPKKVNGPFKRERSSNKSTKLYELLRIGLNVYFWQKSFMHYIHFIFIVFSKNQMFFNKIQKFYLFTNCFQKCLNMCFGCCFCNVQREKQYTRIKPGIQIVYIFAEKQRFFFRGRTAANICSS